jgi:hypothetical protein
LEFNNNKRLIDWSSRHSTSSQPLALAEHNEHVRSVQCSRSRASERTNERNGHTRTPTPTKQQTLSTLEMEIFADGRVKLGLKHFVAFNSFFCIF